MEHTKTAIDKAAMGVSAALMLLGIVVLGLVETLAGQPYGAAPLTNDAGEVIAMPLVDPNLRVGLGSSGSWSCSCGASTSLGRRRSGTLRAIPPN